VPLGTLLALILGWDSAPEFVKEKFRQCARDAIALLEQHREQTPDAA
jgi:hypothetical protein